KFFREFRKRAQAHAQTFFRNEAACLQKFPRAIFGRSSLREWQLLERNSGAMNANFFARAAQIDEAIGKRMRAHERESNAREHSLHRGAMTRLVHIDH